MCNFQSSVYLRELNGVLHRLVATAINSIHNNNNSNNNNNNNNDDDDDDDNKKHKRFVYSWVSRKNKHVGFIYGKKFKFVTNI